MGVWRREGRGFLVARGWVDERCNGIEGISGGENMWWEDIVLLVFGGDVGGKKWSWTRRDATGWVWAREAGQRHFFASNRIEFITHHIVD